MGRTRLAGASGRQAVPANRCPQRTMSPRLARRRDSAGIHCGNHGGLQRLQDSWSGRVARPDTSGALPRRIHTDVPRSTGALVEKITALLATTQRRPGRVGHRPERWVRYGTGPTCIGASTSTPQRSEPIVPAQWRGARRTGTVEDPSVHSGPAARGGGGKGPVQHRGARSADSTTSFASSADYGWASRCSRTATLASRRTRIRCVRTHRPACVPLGDQPDATAGVTPDGLTRCENYSRARIRALAARTRLHGWPIVHLYDRLDTWIHSAVAGTG